MKSRFRKHQINALSQIACERRARGHRDRRYTLRQLMRATRKWRLSLEDRAWLDMPPVGREFGSPDYERLLELDALTDNPPAGLKVFLDDEREAPPGWTRVLWPDEAIQLLQTGQVSEVSLDHDLGNDARGTGHDVIVWIENAVAEGSFRPPKISVHSADPAARQRMELGIETVERMARQAAASPAQAGDRIPNVEADDEPGRNR